MFVKVFSEEWSTDFEEHLNLFLQGLEQQGLRVLDIKYEKCVYKKNPGLAYDTIVATAFVHCEPRFEEVGNVNAD